MHTVTVWFHGEIIIDALRLDDEPLNMLLDGMCKADPFGIKYKFLIHPKASLDDAVAAECDAIEADIPW